MAPRSKLAATKAKAAQNAVKEKVFHPQSRKAGQLERASLRKGKLASQSQRRSRKQIEKADRFGFFLHALPPDVSALTLPQFHELITDLWLTRHDAALRHEETTRRKGRPQSAREVALRELKLRDEDEYKSGLELPDLTHAATVELFRKWENGDPAYLHLLQFVRLSSANPTVAPIVKHGLQQRRKGDTEDRDVMELDVTEKTGSLTALQRAFPDVPLTAFSSTIQNMDGGT